MATYPFAGGINPIQGYGSRWKIFFNGTWAVGDTWTVAIASSAGKLTLGMGNFAGINPTVCFTYRGRVYLGMGSQFNFSDNDGPTAWEQQDPGAGFVKYLSQYGGQDAISALGQLQGRLAVFARRSVQIWTVDADPNNFSLVQTLENIGTQAPLSVQNLGDYDVLFRDDTGIRSLRSREVTLNAYVDDVGSPVDALVQAAEVGYTVANEAAIVDPKTHNYWLHVNGQIFVFSRYPSSKISAWSTFETRGNDNVTFLPQKFVVYNGQIYCRSTTYGHYVYGGANNATYDQYSQVTWQLPWLDDKKPDTFKMFTSLNAVMQGKWQLSFSANPQDTTPFANKVVYNGGSAATPNDLTDSTYDIGNIKLLTKGTHFSVQGVSQNTSTTKPAIFTSLAIHYNFANIP